MSKARAKGTGWEVELLPILRGIFGPQVERAPLKGVNDFGDFIGTDGYLVEAKKTDVPHFLQWAKTAQKKTASARLWRVLWSGDRRKGDGPFVLMHLDAYAELEWKAARYDDTAGLVVGN